jgi:Protein O-mannosyl-transferase TMEM260-like
MSNDICALCASAVNNLKRREAITGLVLIGMVAVLYLSTLQTDINGSGNEYMVDAGEFQVALPLWGTVHYPGYPMYSMLGSAFVTLMRLVGMAPAAGASLFSFMWGIAAIVGLYAFLCHLDVHPLLAAGSTFALAVTWMFWLHGSIAATRSMSLAFVVALLWLTWRATTTLRERDLMAWAACLGLALSHHRFIGLVALPMAFFLVPALWSRRTQLMRLLPAMLGLAAAGFVWYLYPAVRQWQGTSWIYGRPGTWAGFWEIFWAREYQELFEWPRPAQLLGNFVVMLDALRQQWTWVGMLAGGGGLIAAMLDPAARRRPELKLRAETVSRLKPTGAHALLARFTGLGIFSPTIPSSGVPGTQQNENPSAMLGMERRKLALILIAASLPAVVLVTLFPIMVTNPLVPMPVTLFLAVGMALLADALRRARAELVWPSLAVLLALALYLVVVNRPSILALTRDSAGRRVIATLRQMPVEGGGDQVFVAPWGGDFFAAAYGLRVTHELSGFDIADHRADLASLARERRVIVLPWAFDWQPFRWWRERVGRGSPQGDGRLLLTSAAMELVELGVSPKLTSADVPPGMPVQFGDQIELAASQVRPLDNGRALDLTLYWRTIVTPTADYSVFVHASDKDAISSQADIIAQADSAAPVYGHYKTTRWRPGEIVRDDYRVDVPPGVTLRLIEVGLYTRDETGAFHNLGVARVCAIDLNCNGALK